MNADELLKEQDIMALVTETVT